MSSELCATGAAIGSSLRVPIFSLTAPTSRLLWEIDKFADAPRERRTLVDSPAMIRPAILSPLRQGA